MKDTHKHIIIGGWRGGGRPWAPPSSGYFATLAPLQEAVVPGRLITAICHTLCIVNQDSASVAVIPRSGVCMR